VATGDDDEVRRTVVVLARSAISSAPIQELGRACGQIKTLPGVERATFAFSEQGHPSLREVFDDLLATATRQILIVPFLMPAEPRFNAWLATTLQRWRGGDARPWPQIRVAQLVADHPAMADVLRAIVASGGDEVAMPSKGKVKAQGCLVPEYKRCVLVCRGSPCNVAGAPVIWGHLRNERDRLSLHTVGGVFLAKASCLGPCALAPVVQVWPDGTYYGGVDESGMDRIIHDHLFNGKIVEELAYRANGRKQYLRS
jgi:(2Fe-2S) ferredoxin